MMEVLLQPWFSFFSPFRPAGVYQLGSRCAGLLSIVRSWMVEEFFIGAVPSFVFLGPGGDVVPPLEAPAVISATPDRAKGSSMSENKKKGMGKIDLTCKIYCTGTGPTKYTNSFL